MINILGESGSETLKQINDLAKYLHIPYTKLYEWYQIERGKVTKNFPSLPIENKYNLMFVEQRTLGAVYQRLEQILMED